MKVIDWIGALEQVGGDEDFLIEVLQDLLVEATAAVEQIQEGINISDFSLVMHSAHRIKGSASYLCCDELREISLQLQDCGRAGMKVAEAKEAEAKEAEAKEEGGEPAKLWIDIRKKLSRYNEALEALRKEASSRK